MSIPLPKYTFWEGLNVALHLGMRALEEIRTLARTPGPRGADGLGFDDLQFEQTSERSFTLRFVRGDIVKEWKMTVSAMIYRGVWVEQLFERGDSVTWDGSIWVALKDTAEKPRAGADWQLACKRGRDGRDGEMKAPREPKLVKVG